MKKLFRVQLPIVLLLIAGLSSAAFSQANTSLSNLVAPTSVNQSLLPSSTNSKNLGSSTAAWKDGWFLGKLSIGGTTTPSTMLDITPPTTSGGAINIRPNSALLPSTGELRFSELTSNGSNYVGFKSPSSIIANKIWTLPAADGTSGQVLSTNGSGILSWVSGTGGAESDPEVGVNTTNFIPRWDGTALISGSIYDNGSKIGIGTTAPGGYLHISANGDADLPHIQIKEAQTDGYARIYLSSFTGELGDNRKWKILGRTSLTEENNNFLIQQVSSVDGVEFGSTRLSILHNGDMGIGTSAPLARLHVVTGVNDKFRVGSETGTPAFIVDALGKVGVNVLDPNSTFHVDAPSGEDAMRIQVNGSSKLFVSSNGGVSVGGPTIPPVNGLFVTGSIGLGTSTPQTKLHISGTDEVLRLDGTNPYMRFFNAGVEKSYLQQSGDDFKFGTTAANTNGKVQITAGSAIAMTIKSSGKVGIGTASPGALLHLKGSGSMLRVDGTDGAISFYSGSTEKGFIQRQTDDLVVASNSGKVVLGNNVAGSILFITTQGTVGIGTSDTKGYKFAVDGSMVCEELKVKLSQSWPDYVFADEYKLPTLEEVENSISVNKHLPGIPSAQEIHEEGINVGEMQKLMMQKIEELTLYVIDLQKQNNDLRSEVVSLRSAIK